MNPVIERILRDLNVDPGRFTPSRNAPNVRHGVVPGSIAGDLWQHLRKQHLQTGVWPIIRGELHGDVDDYPFDPSAILRAVPHGNLEQLFDARFREQIEMYADIIPDGLRYGQESLESLAQKIDRAGIMTASGASSDTIPWPTEHYNADQKFHTVVDFQTGQPHPSCVFALIETMRPFETPAYLGFGGWNDAPMPELQVAALREWADKYGAVPACVTNDVLECWVERPPQTEADAMRLAAEQRVFCDDIVSQGTQSVRKLAIELWRSPHWFFWWD